MDLSCSTYMEGTEIKKHSVSASLVYIHAFHEYWFTSDSTGSGSNILPQSLNKDITCSLASPR